jgi:hypothetical protein
VLARRWVVRKWVVRKWAVKRVLVDADVVARALAVCQGPLSMMVAGVDVVARPQRLVRSRLDR